MVWWLRSARRSWVCCLVLVLVGIDESGAEGDDGGVNAVAGIEFGEYSADVIFDGGFGEVKVCGDFAVCHAVPECGEDVTFAGGDLTGQVAVGGAGRGV
jgi:hypothetical protein